MKSILILLFLVAVAFLDVHSISVPEELPIDSTLSADEEEQALTSIDSALSADEEESPTDISLEQDTVTNYDEPSAMAEEAYLSAVDQPTPISELADTSLEQDTATNNDVPSGTTEEAVASIGKEVEQQISKTKPSPIKTKGTTSTPPVSKSTKKATGTKKKVEEGGAFVEYKPTEAMIASASSLTDFQLTASRQPFTYLCPPGAALSYMYSVHRNNVEDRHWRFGCRKITNMYLNTGCKWSNAHAFDQPLQGMCADGYVVTGFRGLQYSAYHKDRRFRVKCCKSEQVQTCCTTTDYINDWDGVMNFKAPANKIIAGIYSVHNNAREDRRFKLKICGLKMSAIVDCTC